MDGETNDGQQETQAQREAGRTGKREAGVNTPHYETNHGPRARIVELEDKVAKTT